MADFTLGWIWILSQQLTDSHDHPRHAEAALQGVVFMKSRLHRMQFIAGRRMAETQFGRVQGQPWRATLIPQPTFYSWEARFQLFDERHHRRRL